METLLRAKVCLSIAKQIEPDLDAIRMPDSLRHDNMFRKPVVRTGCTLEAGRSAEVDGVRRVVAEARVFDIYLCSVFELENLAGVKVDYSIPAGLSGNRRRAKH